MRYSSLLRVKVRDAHGDMGRVISSRGGGEGAREGGGEGGFIHKRCTSQWRKARKRQKKRGGKVLNFDESLLKGFSEMTAPVKERGWKQKSGMCVGVEGLM